MMQLKAILKRVIRSSDKTAPIKEKTIIDTQTIISDALIAITAAKEQKVAIQSIQVSGMDSTAIARMKIGLSFIDPTVQVQSVDGDQALKVKTQDPLALLKMAMATVSMSKEKGLLIVISDEDRAAIIAQAMIDGEFLDLSNDSPIDIARAIMKYAKGAFQGKSCLSFYDLLEFRQRWRVKNDITDYEMVEKCRMVAVYEILEMMDRDKREFLVMLADPCRDYCIEETKMTINILSYYIIRDLFFSDVCGDECFVEEAQAAIESILLGTLKEE